MSQLLFVSPPHLHAADNVSKRLWMWNLALLPFVIGAVGAFGWQEFGSIIIGIMGAVAGEFLGRAFVRRGARPSAPTPRSVSIGILTVLLLNPGVPYGIIFLSCLFATLIAQEFYGGLGASLFHPALVGWMFVRMYSFTVGAPDSGNALLLQLAQNTELNLKISSFWWGARSGTLGEASLLAACISAAILFFRRAVTPVVPALFLAGIFFVSLAAGGNPGAEFFLSSTCVSALFLVTDPEASPSSRLGKYVYGVLCGAVFVCSKIWNADPSAPLYGLLVMNGFVPLMDRGIKRFYNGRRAVWSRSFFLTICFLSCVSTFAIWAKAPLADESFALARRLLCGVLFFAGGAEVFLSMAWRLSITPVPANLRGTPILMISSGLFTAALLGLSGLF